jgi:alpha-mannosidase
MIIGDGVQVEAQPDQLSFRAASDVTIGDWIVLEVEGERGDLYTRSAIPGTRAVATLMRSRITARGPLRAELSCDWKVAVPERRLTSAAGEPRRAPAVRLDLQTVIQVDAGAPFVRVLVRGDNRATDARIRIGLRTGLLAPLVVADAAFGPVVREPVVAADATREMPPRTAPLHRHVSLFSDHRAVSVFSDGLAEYEVDQDGVVWVTLRRAVGELSRHDLPERPGHAGYPAETPAAQSIGSFEAAFAFALHGPRSDGVTALVESLAEEVLAPLRGETWRTAIDPPPAVTGAELAGDGLAFSAIKESEDGGWLVLRCVNLLERPVAGSWALPSLREAFLARLDETPLAPLEVHDDRVEFLAPPRGIVSILAR